jgi:predicted NBD/HSP70 family sugar kinase
VLIFLCPQRVVIGGGVVRAGDLLLERCAARSQSGARRAARPDRDRNRGARPARGRDRRRTLVRRSVRVSSYFAIVCDT